MGQLFHACAFDMSDKTCFVIDADKFHANHCSFNCITVCMHYLLRQKPYNVMWGGSYVIGDLDKHSRAEYLLGLSTYVDCAFVFEHYEDVKIKPYYDKLEFIHHNSKLWKMLNIEDVVAEGKKYFNCQKYYCVNYSGYLLNHTKKMAINLADYYLQSKSLTRDNHEFVVDLIPYLTETGDGAPMSFYDGVSNDTTEGLAGKWCADLLQIVDEMPEDYTLINCCFTEIWYRVRYCYRTFGVNADNLVLNYNGNPLKVIKLSLFGHRNPSVSPEYVKVERTDEGIKYVAGEMMRID